MKLINLKRANQYDVQNWLLDNIPDLTDVQKQKIRDWEIVRFAPFYFMQKNKRAENIFIRLSIVFLPFVWLILVFGLPINFFITGNWGYNDEKISWFSKWISKIGL